MRKFRAIRYIPKTMWNLISLRRSEKIGYTMKTQGDGVLKGAKGCLAHLKGVMDNYGHVLLKSKDLHHAESDVRLKSPRKMTFVDGDYHDGWCTKKVKNGFGLEGS